MSEPFKPAHQSLVLSRPEGLGKAIRSYRFLHSNELKGLWGASIKRVKKEITEHNYPLASVNLLRQHQ